MLKKNFSLSLIFVLAINVASSIFSPRTAAAQEIDGFSVGKVTFGKKTDDKWLTVDLKKTNRLSGGPTVNTYSRPNFQSGYTSVNSTIYGNRNASAPLVSYPPASTMVSNHRLLQAASIALNSARGHSTGSCWRYVKSALLKSEAINSYPKTGYAKQAASELVHDYGFVRTAISNPFSAPIGSVLVYGGAGAGHVEIRTRTGFVSDFVSAKPSSRPLIGVFVK